MTPIFFEHPGVAPSSPFLRFPVYRIAVELAEKVLESDRFDAW
jgi:hypothetical protein